MQVVLSGSNWGGKGGKQELLSGSKLGGDWGVLDVGTQWQQQVGTWTWVVTWWWQQQGPGPGQANWATWWLCLWKATAEMIAVMKSVLSEKGANMPKTAYFV